MIRKIGALLSGTLIGRDTGEILMKNLLLSLILLIVSMAGALAQTAPDEKVAAPQVQDLGNQRYRIGEIEIDKAKGEFRVSGRVLRAAPPLEFVVVTQGGHKAYEALLEVNADAFQFNLACILIGLDASLADPGHITDMNQPVKGDPVEISVSWLDGGKNITVNASDLLVVGEPAQRVESQDWVYTGSLTLDDGRYFADLSGTLIGFVHRQETIIEHKQGIGLGNYGSVNVNRDIAPPVGTQIELIVRRSKPI